LTQELKEKSLQYQDVARSGEDGGLTAASSLHLRGGAEKMTANTNKQLEGAKKRASVAPAAKKRKTAAKKSAGSTRGSAAARAAKVSSQPSRKRIATDETPKNEKSHVGAVEQMDESPREVTASGTETTSGGEAIGEEHGTDESTSKSSGAKSSTGGGDPVKPLTEAGKKRLVNKLLGLAETQATQGGFKITPADLIRLMQLHKEMTPQRDRKVTVQWIEDKPE
jgi:hypothetical protein